MSLKQNGKLSNKGIQRVKTHACFLPAGHCSNRFPSINSPSINSLDWDKTPNEAGIALVWVLLGNGAGGV